MNRRFTVPASVVAIFIAVSFSFDATAQQGDAAITLEKTVFESFQDTKRESYDLILDLKAPEGTNRFDSVDVVFAFQGPGNYDRFTWDTEGWSLTQIADGEKSCLADKNAKIPESLRGGGTLIIKNRAYTIEVVADDQRVLNTLAHGTCTGVSAIATGKTQAVVESSLVQGIAPFVFGDDFSREEDETGDFGVWEPFSGDWMLHSVAKDIKAKPELRKRTIKSGILQRISNPFSLSGTGTATNEALIVTGYSFWNDYTAAVSTKTSGGTVGLAFGVMDADNLWFVRWTIATRRITASSIELVKRVHGVESIVSTATVRARTDNWYRLAVRSVGPFIDVAIDDYPVMAARDELSLGGPVGLMVFDEGTAHFDDVNVDSVKSVSLSRETSPPPFLEAITGQWSRASEKGIDGLTGRNSVGGQPAIQMLGSHHWVPRSLEARFLPGSKTQAAGLVFAEISPGNQWQLVWRTEQGGHLDLSCIRDGKETYNLSVPLPLNADRGIHLRAERTEDGRLRGSVNGQLEILADDVPELTGRVGILADSDEPVNFSEVLINAEASRSWERPVKVGEFADDPYMQGWASPRHAWSPAEKTATDEAPIYRHKGDFYGDMSVGGPLTDALSIRFGSDDIATGPGYRVAFSFGNAPDEAAVTLERCGEKVAQASFKHGPREVIEGEQVIDEKIGPLPLPAKTVSYGNWEVRRDGSYILVEAGGRRLISYRDPTPLKGRELALATRESLDLGLVTVKRDRVKDDQFERATTGWNKVGTWEVTNRFSCDPRWSHMNGRSRGVAALWSKLKFSGDYTLEYYAGMRMRQGDMLDTPSLYYPRVGDINVALCADETDLFSGYNLIIAAWDEYWSERWTRFMRQGETVKETDQEFIPRTRDRKPKKRAVEVDWDPGGRPIHGAWYFIKIRKTGTRFDVWFDNVFVFSFEDTEPLTGKHLALWTQDNSIVMARVRVGYRNEPETGTAPGVIVSAEHRTGEQETDAAVPFLSTSHPGRHFDFETGLQCWRSADDDQGARVELVDADGSRGQHALRLINRYGGGNFKATVPLPSIDLDRVKDITFDCAAPTDVRVNLYMRIKNHSDEIYYITLTGPDEETANLIRLGRFAEFKADGTWQRVSFQLAEALRERITDRKQLLLEELWLGYEHGGYLNAGLGGNCTGTEYEIDNFTIASSGPADATLCREVNWPAGSNSVSVSATPDMAGKNTQPLSIELTNTVSLARKGLSFINVFSIGDGRTDRLMSIPVRTDTPLNVKATSPPAAGRWDGSPICIQFALDTSASLLPFGLTLRANDIALPLGSFEDIYDPTGRTLLIDPALSQLELAHDESVDFTLTFRDSVSNPRSIGEPTTFCWNATMDTTLDKTPPLPVELDIPGMVNMTFDSIKNRATTETPKARVRTERRVRDDEINDHALTVANNACGGNFALDLNISKFNAGRFPQLEFDYCVIPEARIDLCAKTAKATHTIGLNDVSSKETKDGTITDARPDGKWHHAKFDLADMLAACQEDINSSTYEIRYLGFADGDYAASPPGAWYALDNIRTVPIISTSSGEPLAWKSHDVGGISGYSYAWDRDPSTQVDKIPETVNCSAVFTNLPEGEMFFHVRACDTAGNWGTVTHHRVLVDNTPPAAASFTPREGSGSAASVFAIALNESLAHPDFSGVRMTFNGIDCRLDSACASLNPERRELTWNWVKAAENIHAPVPNGQKMTAHLSGLRDFAGNLAPPIEWNWNIDYSKDHQGPEAPTLKCWSQHVEQFDEFTDGVGNWRIYDADEECTKMETLIDPETDDSCLRLTKTDNTTDFAAYAFRGALKTSDYDAIAFDYKIPPGTHINMRIYVNSEWQYLLLTGAESRPVLGKVDGIQDDGKWHNVLINLPDILRKAIPNREDKDYIVRYIMLGNWQRMANEIGASVSIDNFAILKAGLPLPEISSSSVDATGIQGHAYTMNRDPRSQAPTIMSQSGSRTTFPVLDEDGMWYIHARARDGAGNWGKTRHYPYYCSTSVRSGNSKLQEIPGQWQVDSAGSTRTMCDLSGVSSASGKHSFQVLSLRTWKADEVRICRKGTNAPPANMMMDFFNQGRTTLSVRPFVSDGGEKVTIGEEVQVPPSKWMTQVPLAFRTSNGGGHTPGTGREWGLVISAPHRARSHLIMGQMQKDADREN